MNNIFPFECSFCIERGLFEFLILRVHPKFDLMHIDDIVLQKEDNAFFTDVVMFQYIKEPLCNSKYVPTHLISEGGIAPMISA